MQHPLLFDSIIKQNLSGLTDHDHLEQVAKRHPYFIPAQFYLLQQMQDTDAGYDVQAAKTAVLFNNPHWLHFQLQQDHTIDTIEEEIVTTAAVIPEPVTATVAEPKKEPQTEEELMLAESEEPANEEIENEPEIAPIKITLPNMEAPVD